MTTGTTRISGIDDKEGPTTMTTTKSTGYVTEMRRCSGSQRFGIEPHEAPVSTFPKQPSRKDGFGVMCTSHWKMYVKALREARLAATGTEPQAAEAKPSATRPRARKATAKPSANAAEVAKAEALIAEVDALPGAEHVERVGDADMQAALEMGAASRMLAD